MDTISAIKNRRSIRKYKDLPVDKAQLEQIVQSGILAPSAKNRQPWKFVVITNKNTINQIADTMIGHHSDKDDKYDIEVLKAVNSVLPTANVIKQCPALILVYQKKDDNWMVGDNLSIGACIENMCLCAQSLNLGTLWVRDTVYSEDKITKLIRFDDKTYKLNSALCVGVSNENPKPRPRNKLKDITTWIS